MKKMSKFIEKFKNKFKRKKCWKVCMYYKQQQIKIIRVNENQQKFGKFYVIEVNGKKHLFGTNKKVTIVVKPILLKYTDTKNKCVHIEIELFEGVSAYE